MSAWVKDVLAPDDLDGDWKAIVATGDKLWRVLFDLDEDGEPELTEDAPVEVEADTMYVPVNGGEAIMPDAGMLPVANEGIGELGAGSSASGAAYTASGEAYRLNTPEAHSAAANAHKHAVAVHEKGSGSISDLFVAQHKKQAAAHEQIADDLKAAKQKSVGNELVPWLAVRFNGAPPPAYEVEPDILVNEWVAANGGEQAAKAKWLANAGTSEGAVKAWQTKHGQGEGGVESSERKQWKDEDGEEHQTAFGPEDGAKERSAHRAMQKDLHAALDGPDGGYHDAVPVKAVSEAVEKHGFSGKALDGIYTGKEGRASSRIGPRTFMHMQWYKMPSGKYEVNGYTAHGADLKVGSKANESMANEGAVEYQVMVCNETKSAGDNWYQLSPYGDWGHSGGSQRFTKADAEAIVNEFNSLSSTPRRLLGLPWYIGHPDHPEFAQKYTDTKAYGRIKKLEAREDGLWGNVKWSEAGKSLVNEEAFGGHSINWRVKRDKDGFWRPTSVKSVGFTNEPNIPVQPATHANEATGQVQVDMVAVQATLKKAAEMMGS